MRRIITIITILLVVTGLVFGVLYLTKNFFKVQLYFLD